MATRYSSLLAAWWPTKAHHAPRANPVIIGVAMLTLALTGKASPCRALPVHCDSRAPTAVMQANISELPKWAMPHVPEVSRFAPYINNFSNICQIIRRAWEVIFTFSDCFLHCGLALLWGWELKEVKFWSFLAWNLHNIYFDSNFVSKIPNKFLENLKNLAKTSQITVNIDRYKKLEEQEVSEDCAGGIWRGWSYSRWRTDC